MTATPSGVERDSDSPLPPPHHADTVPFLVPLLSPPQKVESLLGAAIWLGTLGSFWIWWFRPEHNIDTLRYVLVTIVLAWVTLLPLYFVAIFINGKIPNPKRSAPTGFRVAMVVTKAPAEPFSVVARTLEAMLRQTYRHNTWLADEDPSPSTRAWCEARGIRISTRNGRADYHRPIWPRRARCKEGNLAFFYDHYGYENYDVVAQLDADHVPSETYLEEILKPFADPSVGYVSAPSICSNNANESWSARGRLHIEGTLHGPLQAGYNNGWAPLCIGSHYAVRTRALKEVGGLGPELAEDHSTTLIMNAHGWRGVHALNAIAHGDGPATFVDLAIQEFQWSRSLATILFKYTPTYIKMMPTKLRFQFLFSQLWYPLFSLFMAAMFAMPIVALVFDVNFVGVSYPDFLVHFAPISFVLVIMAYRWRAAGWCRPSNVKVISWEATLFLFARWPWSLAGLIAAVHDWATGTVVEFRVTPKGRDVSAPLAARVLVPYAALSMASASPALLNTVETARGFYVFAIANAAVYAVLLLTIVVKHAGENGFSRRWSSLHLPAVGQLSLALILMGAPFIAASRHGADGLEAVAWGQQRLVVAKTVYSVSGAGQNGAGSKQFVWFPGTMAPPVSRDTAGHDRVGSR